MALFLLNRTSPNESGHTYKHFVRGTEMPTLLAQKAVLLYFYVVRDLFVVRDSLFSVAR